MKNLILKIALIGILAPAIYSAQNSESPVNQEKKVLPKPYNEKADGEKDIAKLIKKAGKENKNILIQAGGNWCIWCLRFNNYVNTTPELKQIIDDNYLYYHLNYSPKNKNEKAFAKYVKDDVKRGYPFFIFLDSKGKVLGVYESGNLEENGGYNLEKVKNFLNSHTIK